VRFENGDEAKDAVVRHAASAAADRDRGGNVLSAFAAAGQGRHEVLPYLELVMNGELSAVSSALRIDRLFGVGFARCASGD
jgi:hypothetical protein